MTGSILAVLNDPSFEHGHPSWVRRSLRGERMRPSIATPPKDDVDTGGWEVVTEFVSQEEEGDSTRVRWISQLLLGFFSTYTYK